MIVVDNASTDGSPDAVRSRFPQVQRSFSRRTRASRAANNVGIRATSGQLVLLLNSDTIVPAGALERSSIARWHTKTPPSPGPGS